MRLAHLSDAPEGTSPRTKTDVLVGANRSSDTTDE
jgi:hypothetical protein